MTDKPKHIPQVQTLLDRIFGIRDAKGEVLAIGTLRLGTRKPATYVALKFRWHGYQRYYVLGSYRLLGGRDQFRDESDGSVWFAGWDCENDEAFRLYHSTAFESPRRPSALKFTPLAGEGTSLSKVVDC